MYTNELLKEKYKSQKKLYTAAKEQRTSYSDYIEHTVTSLFKEKSWPLKYSSRSGGYQKE